MREPYLVIGIMKIVKYLQSVGFRILAKEKSIINSRKCILPQNTHEYQPESSFVEKYSCTTIAANQPLMYSATLVAVRGT